MKTMSEHHPEKAGSAGGPVPSRADGRRGRPRSEASHQAVLSATARLLDVEGCEYTSLTVEGIAAEAGVGKQTIYRWWPNKAAVVLEALLTGYMRFELAPLPETGDLRADLISWMEAMGREAFTHDVTSMGRSLLMALLQSGPETQELLRNSPVWEHSPLVERLRAEAEAGKIRSDLDLGMVASALADPLLLRLITTGDPGSGEFLALVDIVLDGVAIR